MSFIVEDFAKSPNIEALEGLQKADWLKLAKHYDIDTKNYSSESEIRVNVVRSLVDKKIIGKEAHKLLQTNVMDTNDHLVIERLKLEVDFRKFQIEMKTKEPGEKDQIEVRRPKIEFKKWVERMKMVGEISNAKQGFDVLKNAKLVPPFNEEEVNCYFTHFEKLALQHLWPEEYWTILLQTVLMGKAQQVYSCVSIEESNDYQKVKGRILKVYGVTPETPEGYRQKFRNLRVVESETYVEFIDQKTRLFDQWCDSKGVKGNYDRLKELIIIEEFKNSVSRRMKFYLDENELQTARETASLADVYYLTQNDATWLPNKNEKLGKSPETMNDSWANEQSLQKPESIDESVKSDQKNTTMDPAEHKAPNKENKVLATNVTGTVIWFNVKSGYGVVKLHDTKEYAFIHRSVIAKNTLKRIVSSVADGEEVEFDLVIREEGTEAANVTGPGGEAVKGSPYAFNNRRGYNRRYVRRSVSGDEGQVEGEGVMVPPTRGSIGRGFRDQGRRRLNHGGFHGVGRGRSGEAATTKEDSWATEN